MRSIAMRIPIVLMLANALSGCSLLFVDGPRTVHPTAGPAYPDCTDSKSVPYIDAVLAAGAGSSLLIPRYGGSADTHEVAGALIQVALAGTSAVIGLRRVAACRRARQRFVAAQLRPITVYGPPGSAP
jgi:hypothetical protein